MLLQSYTACAEGRKLNRRLFKRNKISRHLLPELTTEVERLSLVIEIGGMAVRVYTTDPHFLIILQDRYAGYVTCSERTQERAEVDFDVDLASPGCADPNSPVRVTQHLGRWKLERGDFRAEWEPVSRRGWIRQTANPYSIDAVLRIIHTLVLARRGGFLVHSASAIRNGQAFLFAGVSEAGKTTISKLAPPDVTLLSDEISYVSKQDAGYIAFGTPFTGELAKLGTNISAPIAALYLLAKGRQNRIDTILPGEAIRGLLANLLFFAEDQELVESVFRSTFDFIGRVSVSRLTFVPDGRVWELIG
jgi:hypothetical protein